MTNKLALVVAVVLGVLSIVLIRRYVENIEQQHKYEQALKPALVAARDIAPGTVITENDIDTVDFPGKALDQAFKDSRIPIESKGTIINARTVFEVKAGQVFQRYHFPDIGVGRRNDLKGKFTREYRAFTIPIDPVHGVGGMLRPGDYIDILSTIQFTDLAGTSTTATRTILRKVLILAVDDKLNPEDVRPGTTYSTLTLRLSPKDCNRLMFVMSKGGTLQCTYVQETSGEEAGWDTVTAETLYDEIGSELERLQRRGG